MLEDPTQKISSGTNGRAGTAGTYKDIGVNEFDNEVTNVLDSGGLTIGKSIGIHGGILGSWYIRCGVESRLFVVDVISISKILMSNAVCRKLPALLPI